jgi:membrane associated rhomboid family serine protease
MLQVPCQPATNREFSLNFKANPDRTGRSQPIVNLPAVVWVLIVVLFAIEALIQLGGPSWQAFASYNFAFIPARFGPEPYPQFGAARWWSMLTYGLLHADWVHVATNCLWLAVFSKPVEAHLGTLRYLVLLAVSIIAGAVAALFVHWGQPIILVGISAGVSGILAGAIPLMHGQFGNPYAAAPSVRPLRPMEILTNARAMTFTVMWLALTFFTASTQYLTGQAFIEQRAIAWESHLGGFIVGFIMFYVLDATLPPRQVPTLH